MPSPSRKVEVMRTLVGLVLALAILVPAPRADAASGGAAPPGLSFYLVTPCRFLDTRDAITFWYEAEGPLDWRFHHYRVQGQCGIPVGARAVILNATATQATVPGFLTFFLVDPVLGNVLPPTSNLNFIPD